MRIFGPLPTPFLPPLHLSGCMVFTFSFETPVGVLCSVWSLARAKPVTVVLAEPAFPGSHAQQPRLMEAHVGVQGGVPGCPPGSEER